MIKAVFAAAFAIAYAWANPSIENAPVFEQVSDHCFFLRSGTGGENTTAVITQQGALIVDPPAEADLTATLEALKDISYRGMKSSPEVRWVAITDHHFSGNTGTRYFAEKGAVLLASARLHALATPKLGANFWNPATFMPELRYENFEETMPFTWFLFGSQMHLFPEDLEIRIFALEYDARTGGDVVVFVPDEKVLILGDLCRAAYFPDIDTDAEGNALEWIDGLKQVIESVPLLKPAIKPETPPEDVEADSEEPEEEKTLEEEIIVLPSRGEAFSLQDMKDLLEISQKLQRDLSRAVRSGRTLESFLKSSAAGEYRNYGNFESYAKQLFEAISSKSSAEPHKKE